MAEAPKNREALKDTFEGVAEGFKLLVEKIKKWLESGSKPEEHGFVPVAETRDSLRKNIRDQNEQDGKSGRVFVAPRGRYGGAAGVVGNPEVSLRVGDPMLLLGEDGAVVDRLVTAEDVQKQELINRNREYIGAEDAPEKLGEQNFGERFAERVVSIRETAVAQDDYRNGSEAHRKEIDDRLKALDKEAEETKKKFAPDKLEGMVLDRVLLEGLSEDQFARVLRSMRKEAEEEYKSNPEKYLAEVKDNYNHITFGKDEVRTALREAWVATSEKEARGKVKDIDAKKEKKLQDMLRDDLVREGKDPTDTDIKNLLNTKRVEMFARLLREEQEGSMRERVYCEEQSKLKSADLALNRISKGEANGRVLGGLEIMDKYDPDTILRAREARKNGFDRVSIKPTEAPISWTPGGYPGQRYDVKPLPPEGPGPGPDGPVGPTGPETGSERTVTVQDLKNEYDRLRDLYIMDRRATRGAGLEAGVLNRDRANMERAKEAYIGAQMRAAMESVRSATAGMEGEGAARAQTEALTAIGLDLNTRLDQQFRESEREREPNGWYAKFNRFWMSKAGSAVKVVGGVGLTTVGGFTGLLPLVGLGTTMAASGIGWEAGKAWGRNKLQNPEQISRMSAEQVDQVLNSQRELARRQGRVDPERVATIQALEARRDQILTERMRERVQRMILEEGGLSPENITRATTDALNLENGSFLRTGEATDERARKWEIRRRKIAGIAGGIGLGLASLAAQLGQAAGNLVSEAATRTAMRADYDGNGVWNWVRNNGREFWDTTTKTWKATGGVGGFSGAKEILVTLPK